MPQSKYCIGVFVELKCSVSIKLEEVLSTVHSQNTMVNVVYVNMGAFNSYVSHCAKSRNMNRAKYVSNFLICCANNVVEH